MDDNCTCQKHICSHSNHAWSCKQTNPGALQQYLIAHILSTRLWRCIISNRYARMSLISISILRQITLLNAQFESTLWQAKKFEVMLCVVPPLLFTVTAFLAMPMYKQLSCTKPLHLGYISTMNLIWGIFTSKISRMLLHHYVLFHLAHSVFMGIVDIAFQRAGTGKYATPTGIHVSYVIK